MQSENVKSLKASFWYVFGSFLTKGIGILITPIITRLISAEEFGIYSTYKSMLTLLVTITTLNILTSVSIGRFDFKEDEYDEYISSITFLSMISTTIFYIIALAFNEYIELILGLPFELVTFMYFNIILSNTFSILQYKHRSQMRYREFVFLSVLVAILSPIISIILIMIQDNNKHIGYIVGTQLPLMLMGLVMTILIFKKGKTFINKKYWSYSLNISIPMIAHTVSGLLLSQADRIFINAIQGPTQVGIYSLAYSYSAILTTIWTSLNQAWSPWFYSKMKDFEYNEIKSVVKPYTYIFSLLFIGMGAIAPEALKLFGPEEYQNGVWVIPPVLLGMYFQFAYSLFVNIEIFHKKTKYISLGTTIAAIFNVFANMLVIPIYGYIGAAYTTLIGYMLLFIFHYYLVKRITKENIIGNSFILKWSFLMIILSMLFTIFTQYVYIRFILLILFTTGIIHLNKNEIKYFINYFKKLLRNKKL